MEFHSLPNPSLPPLRTFNPPSFSTPRSAGLGRNSHSLFIDSNTNDLSHSFNLPPLNIPQSPNHHPPQPMPALSRQPLNPSPQSLPPLPSVSASPVPSHGGLDIDPWNSVQTPPGRLSSPALDTAFADLLATSTGMDAS